MVRVLKQAEIDESKLHVTFLSEKPDASLLSKLAELYFGQDVFKIVKDSIYLNCPNGYGRTKLTNNFFENKLKVLVEFDLGSGEYATNVVKQIFYK